MNDAESNKQINRITSLADQAFGELELVFAARERARRAADRFVALRDAQSAAQRAMRIEVLERAALEYAERCALGTMWRDIANTIVGRMREAARASAVAATDALEAVRAKPLGDARLVGGAL